MKTYRYIAAVVFSALLAGCSSDEHGDVPVSKAPYSRPSQIPVAEEQMTQLFVNGFDHVSIDMESDISALFTETISATSTPYNNFALVGENPYIASIPVQFSGGDTVKRRATVVADYCTAGNRALEFRIRYPNELMDSGHYKSRVQMNMYGMTPLSELRMSVRLFLPEREFTLLRQREDAITWLTLFEFWNDVDWRGGSDPFRISVNVVKAEGAGEALRFGAHGQDRSSGTWTTLWEATADRALPLGQWMTCDLYFREGDASHGRFILEVTPDGGGRILLFDVTDWTCNPAASDPDGLTDFNPLKLYTSEETVDYVRSQGGELHVLWDDLRVFGVFK